MELPVVGVFPIVASRTQVVDALVFTIVQPVGGKVAVVKPSVNGKATLVPATTVIYPVFVSTSEPLALVAVSVTSYVPAVEYTTVGFCAVEVDGVPPGKDHDHEVGVKVVRSVNVTDPPEHTLCGAEKSATGGNAPGVASALSHVPRPKVAARIFPVG
jgi:hypothetical protein